MNWGWSGAWGVVEDAYYEAAEFDIQKWRDAHLMPDEDGQVVMAEGGDAGEIVRDPTPVEVVIEGIVKGTVTRAERGMLRGALDKAEAPLVGRPAADAGVGRAIGGPIGGRRE